MNKLMTRAGTALVFVVIMLGVSSFQYGYFVLFALLSVFSTLEFLRITKSLRDEKDTSIYRRVYTVIINLSAFFSVWRRIYSVGALADCILLISMK